MSNIIQALNEAKQKRAKVFNDQRALTENVRKEQRSFNADEEAAYAKSETDFQTYDAEVRRLEVELDREQRLALDQHEQRGGTGGQRGPDEEEKLDPEKRYAETFGKYLRRGDNALSREERSILSKHFEGEREERTQTVTTSGGGFTIPQGFVSNIERIMAYFGPMYDPNVVDFINTTSGNDLPWPTLNDTSNTGRLLAINTAVTTTAMTFGQVVFNAFKYSSDQILVPTELMEDENVGLEGIIQEALGERLGRIINQHLTTGTGSSQPNGVVTAAAAGVTAAGAAAITMNDLISLQHSVDRAYRIGPKVAFMFNDSTLGAIKRLSLGSGDATPLWLPSTRQGEPDTLLGHRYHINNNMASIATGNISVIFGDFSKYKVRVVRNMRMRRLDERYADTDQMGFVGFHRIDGDLIAAGSIRRLTQA